MIRQIIVMGGMLLTSYLLISPHAKPLHKLDMVGIHALITNWVRAILSGRVVIVRVGSTFSVPRRVTSGVP